MYEMMIVLLKVRYKRWILQTYAVAVDLKSDPSSTATRRCTHQKHMEVFVFLQVPQAIFFKSYKFFSRILVVTELTSVIKLKLRQGF